MPLCGILLHPALCLGRRCCDLWAADWVICAQVGGSFGAVCGLLLMRWLPTWEIQPGLYAMCAAAAMLGGVFRASISLVVIFVESSKVHSCTRGSMFGCQNPC